jgi:hypothetical protein
MVESTGGVPATLVMPASVVVVAAGGPKMKQSGDSPASVVVVSCHPEAKAA